MMPTATDTRIIIEIVMIESPEKLRKMGLENVYKIPDITVLSVEPITEAHPSTSTSTMSERVQHSASKGFLVQLSIPANEHKNAMNILHAEVLVTKINGSKTTSGVMIEHKVSALCPDQHPLDQTAETGCYIS